MSKSFSNTPYNVKSMNGIITLSDGAGTTIENGQITTKDINSSGKITAIEIEATEVLFNDDLDMNGNDILNVNDINTTLINGSAYPPPVADTLAQILTNGNSAGSNDIDMNGQNITNVTNINGSAYPPTETLAQILTNGNSAGTTDLDMNSQNILNVTNINGSAYPPPSSVDNLADTLLQGNSAGATNIDMNSQDVENVDELQVDNITGRNGVGNDIRLNSDINVNGNDFQNCNFINFSAFTGALYCPNTLQIQAGTGATTGDINLVCGNATSLVNITGGDLDMNNNNILNCTNINTTTINGVAPSTANTRFIIGNLAYSGYNAYIAVGDLFGGMSATANAGQIPYDLNDTSAPPAGTRNFYWCNNPSYRVMQCAVSNNNTYYGVVLTPGVWKIKFNIGEIQANSITSFAMSFFIDNNNNTQFADVAGGSRIQQQKARYITVKGASNYQAVPQIDFTVYVGAPGIPEVNSGYAKILGLLGANGFFKPLTGYGSWSIECEQLQAFTWNGLYNGFTPSTGRTAVGDTLDSVGAWNRIVQCN